MVYQDIWINGKKVMGGTRDNCPSRYEILKNFFKRYRGQNIRVLDLGANASYFANRLAEDFPEFEITTVEGREECEIPLKMSEAIYPGIKTITKNLYTEELKDLLINEKYHVVMCLNVLHHIEEHEKILKLFDDYVDDVIIELYGTNPLPGIHDDRVINLNDHFSKKDIVGINGWCHYDFERPFFYLNEKEIPIKGHPVDGFGTCSYSTMLWNKDALRGKLQKDFFLGTLNIKIDKNIILKNPIYKIETNFDEVFEIWPAFIFGFPVYIFHPQTDEPIEHLDLISDHKLRDKFDLTNEDEVIISIDKSFVECLNG
jgi:hypothetical protein